MLFYGNEGRAGIGKRGIAPPHPPTKPCAPQAHRSLYKQRRRKDARSHACIFFDDPSHPSLYMTRRSTYVAVAFNYDVTR
jgi:hypothetical protein